MTLLDLLEDRIEYWHNLKMDILMLFFDFIVSVLYSIGRKRHCTKAIVYLIVIF